MIVVWTHAAQEEGRSQHLARLETSELPPIWTTTTLCGLPARSAQGWAPALDLGLKSCETCLRLAFAAGAGDHDALAESWRLGWAAGIRRAVEAVEGVALYSASAESKADAAEVVRTRAADAVRQLAPG